MHQKVAGWALLALISSSAILHTMAYPQHAMQPLISQVGRLYLHILLKSIHIYLMKANLPQ